MPISNSLDKDKDGQFKMKTEAFAAKTVLSGGVEKSLFKRIVGNKYSSVAGGQSTDLDFVIPYALAKLEAIEIINGDIGDHVILEVIIGTDVVNTFGQNVYLDKSGYYEQRSQYDADVQAGIKFRLKFHNGGATKDIYVNYVLNEVK